MLNVDNLGGGTTTDTGLPFDLVLLAAALIAIVVLALVLGYFFVVKPRQNK